MMFLKKDQNCRLISVAIAMSQGYQCVGEIGSSRLELMNKFLIMMMSISISKIIAAKNCKKLLESLIYLHLKAWLPMTLNSD